MNELSTKCIETSVQFGQAIEQGCDQAESIPVAQNIHIVRRQVAVNNVLGLHLRGSGKFVKLANTFQSDVKVYCKGIMADGRRILSLLSLPTDDGTMLALETQGCDIEDTVAALGACPNICSCSRMAAGFRWALAFSASAQPCARTIPLNLPRRCRSGARSSKDCGSSRSVATRPTLSPGLATETCGSLART